MSCSALSAATPVAAAAPASDGPPNRFIIAPTARLTYDSNVFQLNDDRLSGGRSDIVFTPGVSVQFQRTIGRSSATVSAAVGYDLHKRHKEIDQVTADVNASGHVAIGATCGADPRASLLVQQSNLSGLGFTDKNSQTIQDYGLTLACRRVVGFYPSVSASRRTIDNSSALRELFDSRTETISGGIGYALPSMGTVLFSVGRTRLRQPNRVIAGVEDGSDIMQYTVTVDRSIGARISFTIDASYLDVDPQLATAPHYSGLGWGAELRYRASPTLNLNGSASRRVEGTGDVGVSYVIAESYGLGATVDLPPRTSISVNAQHFSRRFRGEDLSLFPLARVGETGQTLRGDLRYMVGRTWQLGVFGSYSRLDGENDFFDYDRTQIGISASLPFSVGRVTQ